MHPDPRQIICDLGLDPAAVRAIDTLSERHGHAIWRIATPERSYILKWLPEADARAEVGGYLLLRELGVPTLPLHGITAQALLLEDLSRSDRWRLAVQTDMARAEVGHAAAAWYRAFHCAGEALLAGGTAPRFLARETDILDAESILATGRALGLPGSRVWGLAAEHIESLKAAVGRLSVTLNYNDFYWTNLALSRHGDARPDAIVFDYHLIGIGMRYSDCRNVTGSLAGDAVGAFWHAYGEPDPREERLDRPLATLHGLCVATRMSAFPRWAQSCRDLVVTGDLERDLLVAIEVARSVCRAAA